MARRIPMSRATNKLIIPIVASCLIVLILISSISMIPNVQAGDGPKNVRGYIRALNGDPLQGANVTVNIKNGATIQATLWYDLSESDGFYGVTFSMSDWNWGNTIEVIATLGLDSDSNTSIITVNSSTKPIEYVNVTIASIIPEFGTFGSLSVAVMSIAMMAVIVIARRRKLD